MDYNPRPAPPLSAEPTSVVEEPPIEKPVEPVKAGAKIAPKKKIATPPKRKQ